MEDKYDMKYTWVIKNFSTLPSEKIYSNQFVAGGCKWRIMACPKGNKGKHVQNCLSLYLDVAHYRSLPSGWKRHAKFCLTVVNQNKKASEQKETQHWFEHKAPDWGFDNFISLTELHAKDGGFLVNGDVIVVAEVTVLGVIGKLDVETSAVTEIVDVNGFQVPFSQVDFVKRLFDKHPNIASNLCLENPFMKSAYMNLLFSVTKTLSQPLKAISKDDLDGASAAVVSLTATGFKLDWLEKKLEKAKENKERAMAAQTRIHEIDEKLKELEDLEVILKKEKADLLASSDSLLLDDVL